VIKLAEQIALTHHEKWDGTGYPNSLKGEDIPLAGRIVALADVFDALVSTRPYKVAWTVGEAVDYIESLSGEHFDPNVVAVFLEKLPDILRIKTELSE
jgi:putative two-component system response regulator